MTDKIIDLTVIINNDLNPDEVLKRSVNKLQDVVVIGWDKEGEFYYDSSIDAGGEALWLLEKAKKELLGVEDDNT